VLHGVVRHRGTPPGRSGVALTLAPGFAGLDWRLRF